MISVITPTYNDANFLHRYFTSVLDPIIPVSEILICNDGSTDETSKILRQYERDSRVKISSNQNNLGGAATINSLFKMAKGKYVIFLASDDFIIPNRFKGVCDSAVAMDLDLCFGEYFNENDGQLHYTDHIGWKLRDPTKFSETSDLLAYGNYIFGGATLIKREVLSSIRPNSLFDVELDNYLATVGLPPISPRTIWTCGYHSVESQISNLATIVHQLLFILEIHQIFLALNICKAAKHFMSFLS